MIFFLFVSFFFFFNDTATTEIYTLSLHDALPISRRLTANRGLQSGVVGFKLGEVTRSRTHDTIEAILGVGTVYPGKRTPVVESQRVGGRITRLVQPPIRHRIRGADRGFIRLATGRNQRQSCRSARDGV